MDPVKRKVISELFFAPSVVVPIVAGVSAGLLSWAGGGVEFLTFTAGATVLGGVGWMLTRLIFKVEEITERALKFQLNQRVREENERLDQLALRLRADRDHRTQDYLTLLRSLREDFRGEASRPDLRFRSSELGAQLDDVFNAAIAQLLQAHKLWELSEKLVGTARKEVLANREKSLQEVDQTIKHMQSVVNQFRELAESKETVDLAELRKELEETMRVAKRTEERMRELEQTSSTKDTLTRE